MKIHWLIILFIVLIGVIIMSMIFTQQSINTPTLSQEKAVLVKQPLNQIPHTSQPIISQTSRPLPLPQRAITVIKPPVKETPAKTGLAPTIINTNINRRQSAGSASSSAIMGNNQSGITKAGKQPTVKEAQEMNSQGTILY